MLTTIAAKLLLLNVVSFLEKVHYLGLLEGNFIIAVMSVCPLTS